MTISKSELRQGAEAIRLMLHLCKDNGDSVADAMGKSIEDNEHGLPVDPQKRGDLIRAMAMSGEMAIRLGSMLGGALRIALSHVSREERESLIERITLDVQEVGARVQGIAHNGLQ
jgi:hypothetical protein